MTGIDPQTWGWVKLVGGLVALWWAWQSGTLGANLTGSVAILAVLALLGGANVAFGKRR